MCISGENETRRLTLSVEMAGERLDKCLAGTDEVGLSRSKLQTLIENGLVTVNGANVDKKYLVKGGEEVEITILPPEPSHLVPEDIPLNIVHEDDHILVVNKPSGMVTHPAAGNWSGTLANGLVFYLKNLAAGSSPIRPGIVHRLDKNTSGLLVVAKSDEAYAGLRKAIDARQVGRSYLAVVWGHMTGESGTIDLPIGRSPRDRQKMAIVQNGRTAVTHWTLLERFRCFDHLEIKLETGRTHQIRVHLTHGNHPVLGDPDYGGRDSRLRGVFAPERPLARKLLDRLDRQALHACRLQFSHPVSGEEMTFESPLPTDLAATLELLRTEGA